MLYDQQLIEKRNGVISALERIGHFSHDNVSELVKDIVSPGEPWGYRNKIELAFKRNSNKTLVGMYAPNGQDIVRVKDCPLLDKSNQKAVGAVSGALSYLSGSLKLFSASRHSDANTLYIKLVRAREVGEGAAYGTNSLLVALI